jgi:hypothetical protein
MSRNEVIIFEKIREGSVGGTKFELDCEGDSGSRVSKMLHESSVAKATRIGTAHSGFTFFHRCFR